MLEFITSDVFLFIMEGSQCRSDQLDQCPIKRSGTGRARSAGVSTGVVMMVYLAWHRSGFLPENFGHVQNIRIEIQKPSSRKAIWN